MFNSLNVVAKARTALIIPAPQIAGTIGWKIAVIAPRTALIIPVFSSLAFTSSLKLPNFLISSHTSDTFVPITIWN